MPISIDVSGNGKLPEASRGPDSEAPTGFISLEIYLVSDTLNLTVSSGPQLLSQEPGSTVKHLNYKIPDCVKQGAYEVRFTYSVSLSDQTADRFYSSLTTNGRVSMAR